MGNKQKTISKRLLSLLLVLTMVLGMIPAMSISASAATVKGSGTIDDPYVPTDKDTFMDALFWQSGKYIKLKNFTLTYKGVSQWFKMTKDKVFLLEGTNTLNQYEATYPLITVDGCNLTIEGDGVLQYGMYYDSGDEFTSRTQPVFVTQNEGSITVNGGTFKEVDYISKFDPSGLFNGNVTVNDGLFIPQKETRDVIKYSNDMAVLDTSYIFHDPKSVVINGGIFENAFFTFNTYAFCSSDDYKLSSSNKSGWNDVSSYNIKNAVFRFDYSAAGDLGFVFSTREDSISRKAFDKAKLVQTFIKNTQYNNLLLNKDALPCQPQLLISDLNVLKNALIDMNEDGHSLDVVFMNGMNSLKFDKITAAGTAPSVDGEIQVAENTAPNVEITVSLTGRMKEYWDSLPNKDELVNELLRKTTIYLYSADYSQTITYTADGVNSFTVTDNKNDTYTYKLTMPKMSAGDSYRLQVNTSLFRSSTTMITAYENPLTGRVVFTSGAIVGSEIVVNLLGGTVTQVESPLYMWQISKDGGKAWTNLTDENADKKSYIPLASQVGCMLRLCVTSTDYSGVLVSQPLTVTKAVNNKIPTTPTLSVVKDEETGEYTTLIIHNYSEDQEYIWYSGPVSDVSDIDWDRTAQKLTAEKTTGMSLYRACHIYTRFKETEGTKTGTQIAYNYISMRDPLYLQRVTIEGYTDSGDLNNIYVPLGESVTVNVNKEPYDAKQWSNCTFGPRYGKTDIYTVIDGSTAPSGDMPYSITITGDKVGTAELALYYQYGQSYYGMWNVVVYDPDGDIPMVTFSQRPEYDDITLYTGDSLTPMPQTVTMRPEAANAIYNTFEWYVCGSVSDAVSWTPSYNASSNPYISVDKTTGRVTALQDTSSLTGRYLEYKNVVLYAVSSDGDKVKVAQYAVDVMKPDIPLSSITIMPTSAKMEPGTAMTLTAIKTPSNTTVTDPVVWSLLAGSSSFTLDTNGKLTVSKSASEGEWAEVGVYCGETLYNTCKITVESTPAVIIDTIAATIEPPVAGANAAVGPVGLPDGAILETGVHTATAWYDMSDGEPGRRMSDTDVFAEGKTYRITLLIAADSGYAFATPLSTLTLNGDTPTIELNSESYVVISKEYVASAASVTDPTDPTEPTEKYILGDVDMDSKVKINDATMIQKHLASIITLTELQLKAADVTADGNVNIKDATKIQKFLAGLIDKL